MGSERELKPCPFCGQKFPSVEPSADKTIWVISCPNSACLLYTSGRWYYSEEEMAAAWNNRAREGELTNGNDSA